VEDAQARAQRLCANKRTLRGLRTVAHRPRAAMAVRSRLEYKEKSMTRTTRISALLAAFAMATTLGCASTSKSEGTGEYVDDSVITAKVKTAIFEEPTLKSAEINVETFKGTVQLSGFVASQSSADKAIIVARNVRGVTSVKNDMRVK
jgi:osmotically-inducible protein OsmY